MPSRHVFVQIPCVSEQTGESTKLRTTFCTNISFTQHSANWLKMESNSLVHFFLSVSFFFCFVFCLWAENLWCLMKLLPQRHVTSEVTEGLPHWGQSVCDNCFFTIGLTFMALWLTVCVCVCGWGQQCNAQWFWPGPVPVWCLLIFKQNISNGYEKILMTFSGNGDNWTRSRLLHFGDIPDSERTNDLRASQDLRPGSFVFRWTDLWRSVCFSSVSTDLVSF